MSHTKDTFDTNRSSVAGASLSEVLDALADRRRRTVISVLSDRTSPTDIESLAEDIAAEESDASDGQPSQERVDRTHVTLYHVHLPKLADVGVVDYDRERGIVESDVGDLESLL